MVAIGLLVAGLGVGVSASATLAVAMAPLQATAVDAGSTHTCAVTGAGGVRCWGSNFRGQLGDGTTLARSVPVGVRGLSGVRAVGAGDHTCALTMLADIRCWGGNSSGELGDGTRADRRTPVLVAGLSGRATALAVGLDHTCALLDSATVACWGENQHGQLGNGTTVDSSRPVPVPGLTSVAAVAAGGSHTCALTTAGGVQCWGSNVYAQLGTGSQGGSSLAPVDVQGLTSGVASIALGGDHSCAVTTDGGAKCWGIDDHGQLGTVTNCGTFPNWVCTSPGPVDELSTGVAAMTGGPDHTCARMSSGGLKCWGEGNRGQLGNGNGYSYTPADVVGIQTGAAAVSVGASHTCALTTTGEVKCWGDNSTGQVGDGTRRGRSTPVAVPSGPSGCAVPRLKGKTLAAARDDLGRTACALGAVRRAYSGAVKKGRIVSQRPAPGAKLSAGALIRLVVSKGKRGG